MDRQRKRSRRVLIGPELHRNMGVDRPTTSPQIYKQTVHLHLVCHEKIPSSELKDKFRQILVDPVPLIASKVESETESDTLEVNGSEVNEVYKSTKFCDGCVASGVHEGNEFNEDEIHDGVNPGKVIANLLQFKMKKWNMEGATVTIATPFTIDYSLACTY